MTSNSAEEFVADKELEDGARGAAAAPTPYLAPSPDEPSAALQKQEEAWRADLARLEYEIKTLRSVLIAKNADATALKKKLGITPMVEIKQDLQYGIQTIKGSGAYQKTNAALKSFGDFASKKFGDLRNSNAFKSVEEKVGGAYSSVKSRSVGDLKSHHMLRMTSSKSDGYVKDAGVEPDAAQPASDDAASLAESTNSAA